MDNKTNEFIKNEISYDEGWQNVSEPMYSTPYVETQTTDSLNDDVQPVSKENNDKSHKQLLITIQLVSCIIIAIVMCCIKLLGGKLYDDIHNWFFSEMNNSVITTNDDKEIDLSVFMQATKDEALHK